MFCVMAHNPSRFGLFDGLNMRYLVTLWSIWAA
jgi:hypothetical protein